jgi:hypothetical protein
MINAVSDVFLKEQHILTPFDEFPSNDSVSATRVIESRVKLMDLDNFSSFSPESSTVLLPGLL